MLEKYIYTVCCNRLKTILSKRLDKNSSLEIGLKAVRIMEVGQCQRKTIFPLTLHIDLFNKVIVHFNSWIENPGKLELDSSHTTKFVMNKHKK